jgi:hypothetical protein
MVTHRFFWGRATAMDESEKVTLHLSKQEALVFYDYLRRCDDEGKYSFADQAEERVLWTVEGQLEKALSVIFDPRYGQLLEDAWAQVREKE